jgi:hypothetical protein
MLFRRVLRHLSLPAYLVTPVCLQLLGSLKTVLQKAEEHATAQKWDAATVLNLRGWSESHTARLAPGW